MYSRMAPYLSSKEAGFCYSVHIANIHQHQEWLHESTHKTYSLLIAYIILSRLCTNHCKFLILLLNLPGHLYNLQEPWFSYTIVRVICPAKLGTVLPFLDQTAFSFLLLLLDWSQDVIMFAHLILWDFCQLLKALVQPRTELLHQPWHL